jgi:hypothetical protein
MEGIIHDEVAVVEDGRVGGKTFRRQLVVIDDASVRMPERK